MVCGAVLTGGQFQAAVYQLTSGPLHQILLTKQLGTGVNGLSATSPTNVWASLDGVTGAGKLPDASLTGAIASDGNGGVWLAAVNAAQTVPLILHFSHGRWSTSAVPTAKGKLIGIEQLTLVQGTRSVLGTAVIAGSGESTSGTAVVEFRP